MRSEDEIRKRINGIKDNILSDVINGCCFTNRSLQEQRDWIEALEWVLQEDNQ